MYKNSANNEVVMMRADSVLHWDSTQTRYLVLRKLIKDPYGCDSNMYFNIGDFYGMHINSLPFYDFELEDKALLCVGQDPQDRVAIPWKDTIGHISIFNGHFLIQKDSVVSALTYGHVDSIAHFSLLSMDSTLTPLRIELSRTYGMMSFPSPAELNESFNASMAYSQQDQIGWEDSTVRYGFIFPRVSHFIGVAPGDRFLYKITKHGSWYFPTPPWGKSCSGYREVIVDSISFVDSSAVVSHSVEYNTNYTFSDTECYPFRREHDAREWLLRYMSGLTQHLGPSRDGGTPLLVLSDSGFTLSIPLYSGYCDGLVPDERTESVHFMQNLGITMEEWDAGFGGSAVRELIAAKTARGNFGVWPENLGQSEAEEIASANIFPNPSEGLFFFDSSYPVVYEVRDISSRVVLNGIATSVDLSAYPSGLYFLQITTGDRSHTQKLVVSR